MTIPRPRLTVRRLMIVVALVGVALYGLDLHRRHKYARARVEHHQAKRLSGYYTLLYGQDRTPGGAEYRDRMIAKWETAARRPWLPFEADSPEPE